MAVDQLGPAEIVDQAIGGGELAAQHRLALGRRQRVDVDAGQRRVLGDMHVHGVPPGKTGKLRPGLPRGHRKLSAAWLGLRRAALRLSVAFRPRSLRLEA